MEVAAAFDMRLSLDPLLPNAAVDRMLMEAVDPPKPPHTRLVRDLGRLSWLIKGGALLDLLVSTGMFELLLAELEPVDILASPEFDESRVSYSVVPPWTPAEPLAKCWVLQAPTSMPPPAGELLLLPKFARLVKLLYLS